MRLRHQFAIFVLTLAGVLAGGTPCFARSPEATMTAANEVLGQFLALRVKEIPEALLAEAHGVAIVPDLIKVGFVVGGQHGKGVLVVRNQNGSWSSPTFISLTGGSLGWQVGAQSTDVVLVFKTPQSVQGIFEGKFTLGADAAVAAGPVGRQAKAATDAQLKAEIYSYSRSRGLFAGLSIDGSALQIDREASAVYYGNPGPDGVARPVPDAAMQFVEQIAQVTANLAPAVVDPATLQPQLRAEQPFVPQSPVPQSNVPQPAPRFQGPTLQGPATPGPTLIPSEPTRALPRNPLSPARRPATSQVDALRGELSQSAGALSPLLDPTWQRFLVLPAEVYQQGGHPSPDALRGARSRFDAVSIDPRYRELNTRPEFLATRDLLQAYADALTPVASPRLALPPPPAPGPR